MRFLLCHNINADNIMRIVVYLFGKVSVVLSVILTFAWNLCIFGGFWYVPVNKMVREQKCAVRESCNTEMNTNAREARTVGALNSRKKSFIFNIILCTKFSTLVIYILRSFTAWHSLLIKTQTYASDFSRQQPLRLFAEQQIGQTAILCKFLILFIFRMPYENVVKQMREKNGFFSFM